jgi:hypothetical protein
MQGWRTSPLVIRIECAIFSRVLLLFMSHRATSSSVLASNFSSLAPHSRIAMNAAALLLLLLLLMINK